MDVRILELAAEITKQALATEKNGLSLKDEVVEFLDTTARKLAELARAPAGASDSSSNAPAPDDAHDFGAARFASRS